MKASKQVIDRIQELMRIHVEGETYHDEMGVALNALIADLGAQYRPIVRCEHCRDWAYATDAICGRCVRT